MTILLSNYRVLLLSLPLFLSACVTTQDFSHVPNSPATQTALKKYLTEKDHKAFAVAANGVTAYAESQDQPENAVFQALLNCEKAANARCTLAAIDNNSTLPQIKGQQDEHRKLISEMKLKHPDQLMPLTKWFKPETDTVRPESQNLHYATPVSIKGIKTINTPELVKRMKEGNIAVLDTLGISRMNATLPGAYIVSGAAFASGNADKDKAFEERLDKVMSRYFPDKAQPIAALCLSAECWLSVNTLIHLRNIGYTNLYWYRNGILDWAYQELPFTKTNQIIVVD
jgi:rhodanese-related sulfurtransferase